MGKLNLFISAVVWQPGDNEVVERPVAERRVCVIRGVSWSRLCRALLEHCECTLRVLGITHIYVYLYLYVYKGRNKKQNLSFFLFLQKDRFVLYDLHKVFAVDALASSHPLSRREDEVSEPAEISEMFNTISYNKVGAPLTLLPMTSEETLHPITHQVRKS